MIVVVDDGLGRISHGLEFVPPLLSHLGPFADASLRVYTVSTNIPFSSLNTHFQSLILDKPLLLALNLSIYGQGIYHALFQPRSCVSETFHRRIQHA